MFNKWVRHTVITYIELFIKIISLYLIISIVSSMSVKFYGTSDTVTLDENPLLLLIVLAAIIYFAWQLPKFIKQSLGITVESDGSYSLFKNAKEKLKKMRLTAIKVAAAVAISIATGGTAAGASATATASTTTAAGTTAAGTTAAGATAAGTGATAGPAAGAAAARPAGTAATAGAAAAATAATE